MPRLSREIPLLLAVMGAMAPSFDCGNGNPECYAGADCASGACSASGQCVIVAQPEGGILDGGLDGVSPSGDASTSRDSATTDSASPVASPTVTGPSPRPRSRWPPDCARSISSPTARAPAV